MTSCDVIQLMGVDVDGHPVGATNSIDTAQ